MPIWVNSMQDLNNLLKEKGLSFKRSSLKNISGYGMVIGDLMVTQDHMTNGYWISYFMSKP